MNTDAVNERGHRQNLTKHSLIVRTTELADACSYPMDTENLHPYTNPPSAAKVAIPEVFPLWRMPFSPDGPANWARLAERPCPSPVGGIVIIRIGERWILVCRESGSWKKMVFG